MKGIPGSGWQKALPVDGKRHKKNVCRDCGKWAAGKPSDTCTQREHGLYYIRVKIRNRDSNRRHRTERNRRSLEHYYKVRDEVLSHYGGKCACLPCGFDNPKARVRNQRILEMDHINGGGKKHMKTIHNSSLYIWLRSHNYPEGFRVLCIACNLAMNFGEFTCELHKWEITTDKIKPPPQPTTSVSWRNVFNFSEVAPA